jgi:hypothetical protein
MWPISQGGWCKVTYEPVNVDLDWVPVGAMRRSVTASVVDAAGRPALRVELEAEVASGTYDVDFVDMPTFVIIPSDFQDGTISVDIFSDLASDAPDYARGFAGLAYRIVQGGDSFESVYLRPMNGVRMNPPAPRNLRAVQYFAYPDWRFERLRNDYPDGRYESSADIVPLEWTNLRLEIDGVYVRTFVNEREVLLINEAKGKPMRGDIGLFVDIGTVAQFSNLVVVPR